MRTLLAGVIVAAAAGLLGLLSLLYRRTLVRLLRERHAATWEELGRPAALELPWARGARRLGAFLDRGRHYVLNDADVAAAGRLTRVTGRAALVAAVLCVALAWLLGA